VSTNLEVDTTGCVDERSSGTGVDLVGEDVLVEGFGNSLVEAGKQLGKSFSFAANKHRQGVVLIAGDGDAADGVLVADGDFPELDEFFDVRQGQANRIWLGSGAWVYAAA